MQERTKPTSRQRRNYFERGIRVFDGWVGEGGFERFLQHIGRQPGDGYTVDRIDNDRGYEPGNVRWATRKEQSRNQRTNVMITVDGVTKCMSDWCASSGLKMTTVKERLKLGWSESDAVTLPVGARTRWKPPTIQEN